jgi:hypothetical protein
LNQIIKNPTDFTLGILLALVFALDITTTQICLSTGIGFEANPFMRAVIDSPLLTIAVKGVALAIVIGVVNLYKTKWIAHFGMSVVIGITLGAVINNVLVIV